MKEDEVTRIIDKTIKRLYVHHLGKADLDEFMVYKPSMDILKGAMERAMMNSSTYTFTELQEKSKEMAIKLVKKYIQWEIDANGIQEKSPEWYILMHMKTLAENEQFNKDFGGEGGNA